MKRILFALVVALAAMPAAAGPVYNANADFTGPSLTSAWSYGYAVGIPTSGFIAFTSYGVYPDFPITGLNAWYATTPGFRLPAVIKNDTGSDPVTYATVVQPAGLLNLHPLVSGGQNVFSIVRFTAPEDGEYSYTALFQGIDPHPTTTAGYIYLLLDNQLMATINNYGVPVTQSAIVGMAAGATLDFVVGPGTDGFYYDSTGFNATVTAVPDAGATLLLFGMGLAGLTAFRRWRG